MTQKVRFLVLFLVCIASCAPLFSQALAISLEPGATIPLVEDGAAVLSPTGGLRLSADLGFGSLPLFVGLESSYDLGAVKLAGTLVQTVAGGPELGVSFELAPRVSLRAQVSGGYYYTMLDNAGTMAGGGSFYAGGAIGARFLLSPTVDLGLSVGYRELFGLYGGITAALGTSIALGDTSARVRQIEAPASRATPLGARKPDPDKGLRFSEVRIDSIFPVLRNFYDDNPVGYMKLMNQEKVRITGVSARLFVKSYMDSPKEIAVPAEIAPGATVTVDLYALLNKSVMRITEGEKAPVEITLKYNVRGDDYEDSTIRTMTIYGRNNMTWDDTRKAAAFVTRYDPTVQMIARNAGLAIADQTSEILTRRLLSAMAVHRMTILSGLQYRVDPTSSYATLSGKQSAVDSLSFPVETIDKQGGDCDDLSILYAAALEALGVPTAFVTAPGHIYVAIDLGVSPSAASQAFVDSGDLFARDGRLWMPIEVTERTRGFVDAWRLGAQEWKASQDSPAFGVYPLADAFAVYKPVQADDATAARPVPGADAIGAALKLDIDELRQRELSPQLQSLGQRDPRKSDPVVQNRIAVLLARWGDLSGAEAALAPFTRSMETAHGPALVNMGLIRMLRGKPAEAMGFFAAAVKLDPSSPSALAGQARAAYELGRTEEARASWDLLNAASPATAERISYVVKTADGGARAAAASDRGDTVWAE